MTGRTVNLKSVDRVAAIPTPAPTLQDLYVAVVSLKQTVEVLARQTSSLTDSALRVRELERLGLATSYNDGTLYSDLLARVEELEAGEGMTVHGAVMYGGCDDFNYDTTPSKLVNYPFTSSDITADPVAGELTIDRDGIWLIGTNLSGLQPSNTQNETMMFFLDVSGARVAVDAMDIATNRTDIRAFGRTFAQPLKEGDVLSLWAEATANMGIFNINDAGLEAIFIGEAP